MGNGLSGQTARLRLTSDMLRCAALLVAFAATHVSISEAVSVCPGEGPRYGDYKCNHDGTHRVCARLKDSNGNKLQWGSGDFWAITQQPDWSSSVGSDPNNPGGDWCICMWATASLIQKGGCENVPIDCAATDVTYVMSKYTDGGTDLSPARACLSQKCGAKELL